MNEWEFREQVIQLGERIVAAIDDLKTAVTNLNASVSAEIAAVTTALQNAAAGNNGSVSAADAESIVTQLQTLQATIDAETAALTAPPATPAA